MNILQDAWFDGPVIRNMQAERQQLQALLAVNREAGDAQVQDILRRLMLLHELARLDDAEAAYNAVIPF